MQVYAIISSIINQSKSSICIKHIILQNINELFKFTHSMGLWTRIASDGGRVSQKWRLSVCKRKGLLLCITNSLVCFSCFSPQVCIWSDVFPVRWKESQYRKSEQWCENWLAKEKTLKPINIHQPYCPCVASIAENDVGHFHRDPVCDRSKNSVISNCTYYPNAQKCFRRNIKRWVLSAIFQLVCF